MAGGIEWAMSTALCAAAALIMSIQPAPSTAVKLSPNRLAEIAKALPMTPRAGGQPASDRSFWTSPEASDLVRPAIARAEALLAEPLPPLPGDLYLDYSKTGNRTRYQDVNGRRMTRIPIFALAEAAEGKGRFIRPLEEAISAMCDQKSWILPAHDSRNDTFYGRTIHLDLVSTDLSAQIAAALWLHSATLSPSVQVRAKSEIRRRVVDPFLAAVRGQRPRYWWMDTTNNWNSVCLAGVVGGALASVENREERAEVAAAAEALTPNFLSGFTKDGYCSEGLAYWNYGYGRFLLLAETLHQGTSGVIDLLSLKGAESAGKYGALIEMAPGLAPAFSDCDVTAVPSKLLLNRLARRWAWAGKPDPKAKAGIGHLPEFLTFNFAPPSKPSTASGTAEKLRTWFDIAGVYIGRPADSKGMAVAFKGGHNNEHHNHNDVGSYVISVGGKLLLLDPGRETYTARTFSAQRYDSKLLSSYGHPVPVIGEKLQSVGEDAKGVVKAATFKPEGDQITIDFRSCYAVPQLVKLVRTFDYSRSGQFIVTDLAEFSEPTSFETALITHGKWEDLGGGVLKFSREGASVKAQIDTGGAPYSLEAAEIVEDAPIRPTRIAIRLKGEVRRARVTVTFIKG